MATTPTASRKRIEASGRASVFRFHLSAAILLRSFFPQGLALVCFGVAVVSLGLGLGVAGCGTSPSGAPASGASTSAPRIYHLEGVVVSVDKPMRRVVVNHKAIAGLMAAMTMGYPVAVEDAKMLDQLAPGDQITADVVVDDAGARLRNIVIVKKGEGGAAAPAALRQGPAGVSGTEAVPDFTLINQDGARISTANYRGKALLITFIYTRCPLPDQCPLMTHNFAVIEKTLAGKPAMYDKTHLLSISFDPQYDTPAILRNYARGFGEDRFEHWEFATLPASETREVAKSFNIFLSEQQGQINHSTCTAIIAPDGTLYRWYSGNDWKPATVVADLASLLSQSAPGAVREQNETAAR